jgi:uncharacterized protein GlcG (DUF336 family)
MKYLFSLIGLGLVFNIAAADGNTTSNMPTKPSEKSPHVQHVNHEKNTITIDMAEKMADAAEAAARSKNFSIVISIFDQHGNLKYFRRMDNTSVGSIQVSQLKASTAAQFPVSTKVLAERNVKLPGQPYSSIPGFLLLEGGLPVMTKDGVHVGGIGISGATPELDAVFAQAGLDAFLN